MGDRKWIAECLWRLADLLEAEHLKAKALGIETNIKEYDYFSMRKRANELWEA